MIKLPIEKLKSIKRALKAVLKKDCKTSRREKCIRYKKSAVFSLFCRISYPKFLDFAKKNLNSYEE